MPEQLLVLPISREPLPSLLMATHFRTDCVLLVRTEGTDAELAKLQSALGDLGIATVLSDLVAPFDPGQCRQVIQPMLAEAVATGRAVTVSLTTGTKPLVLGAATAAIATGTAVAYLDGGSDVLHTRDATGAWRSMPLRAGAITFETLMSVAGATWVNATPTHSRLPLARVIEDARSTVHAALLEPKLRQGGAITTSAQDDFWWDQFLAAARAAGVVSDWARAGRTLAVSPADPMAEAWLMRGGWVRDLLLDVLTVADDQQGRATVVRTAGLLTVPGSPSLPIDAVLKRGSCLHFVVTDPLLDDVQVAQVAENVAGTLAGVTRVGLTQSQRRVALKSVGQPFLFQPVGRSRIVGTHAAGLNALRAGGDVLKLLTTRTRRRRREVIRPLEGAVPYDRAPLEGSVGLVTVVGHEVLPQLLSVLHARADAVVFVSTSDMQDPLVRIVNELRQRAIPFRVARLSDPFSPATVAREIGDALSGTAFKRLVFNATSGTKATTVAMGTMASADAEVIYVDTRGERVARQERGAWFVEPLVVHGLDIATFVRLSGCVEEEPEGRIRRAREVSRLLGREALVFAPFLEALRKTQQSMSPVVEVPGFERPELLDQLLDASQRSGLVRSWRRADGTVGLTFADMPSRNFLAGGFWLEDYVFEVARSLGFDEVRRNVGLVRPQSDKTLTDFDVAVRHGARLFVLSCKATTEVRHTQPLDALIEEIGGLASGAMLISTQRTPKIHQADRGHARGVVLQAVGLADLADLADRLKSFIGLPAPKH